MNRADARTDGLAHHGLDTLWMKEIEIEFYIPARSLAAARSGNSFHVPLFALNLGDVVMRAPRVMLYSYFNSYSYMYTLCAAPLHCTAIQKLAGQAEAGRI